MSYKIIINVDENKNRVTVNQIGSTIQQHEWDFKNTQTARVNRRNAGPAMVKELELEQKQVQKAIQSRLDDVRQALGNRKPKYLDNSVYTWTDLDFKDFENNCKLALQDSHPNITITANDVKSKMVDLLTKLLTCSHISQMSLNIKQWLKHSNEWLADNAKTINAIMDNFHDDESTDTTTVYPVSTKRLDNFRSYAKMVQVKFSANRQQKLQRYRIRTAIEQAISKSLQLQKKQDNHHQSKEKDDGLEL